MRVPSEELGRLVEIAKDLGITGLNNVGSVDKGRAKFNNIKFVQSAFYLRLSKTVECNDNVQFTAS